jgi:predicted GIY-YIG superfamily endonuclease
MTQTFVYAIYCPNKNEVKIGYATDPLKRLSQLQTGTTDRLDLLYTFVGGLVEEKKIHERLKSHRISGEWFKYNSHVIAVILEFLAASHPTPIDFIEDASDKEIILQTAVKMVNSKRSKKITIPDLKANLHLTFSTRQLKTTLLNSGWSTIKFGTCKTVFYTNQTSVA